MGSLLPNFLETERQGILCTREFGSNTHVSEMSFHCSSGHVVFRTGYSLVQLQKILLMPWLWLLPLCFAPRIRHAIGDSVLQCVQK